MRLLVDGSAHAGKAGGIPLYLERLTQALTEFLEVTVLTSVPERFEPCGCSIIQIPKWTRRHIGRIVWESTRLHGYASKRYDALFCATPIAPPLVRLPILSVVHDITPLVMHRVFDPRSKALFWSSLQTLRWADAVFTVSNHTMRDLRRMKLTDPERSMVVYPGIQNGPTAGTSTLGDELRPFLLYVGSHRPNKNLKRLAAAFARLRGHDRLKLVIAGGDIESQLLLTREAVREVGVQGRVAILDRELSAVEISSLYRACSCFVHPSLYEGFGSPLIEALAHGAPATCSKDSSLSEVAGDAATTFDPTSIADIARAIQQLLDDDSLRARLRDAGPERARLFTWRRAALAVAAAVHRNARHQLQRDRRSKVKSSRVHEGQPSCGVPRSNGTC